MSSTVPPLVTSTHPNDLVENLWDVMALKISRLTSMFKKGLEKAGI
jgi:hypothetical protein